LGRVGGGDGAVVLSTDFSGDKVVNSGGSALIQGATGVRIDGLGTITNTGTIAGTGGVGVDLAGGGTVVDSGTIVGSNGTAISFGGTGSNLLVLEHGYALNGDVATSTSAGAINKLELAGSVGAALTVNYNGLGLTNFQDVLFGSGGDDTLDISNTSGTLPVTISGLNQTGDIIDLTAIGTNGTISSQSASEVTVAGSLGSVTVLLDGSDAAVFQVLSDAANGTDLEPACFCRGTLIRTPDGEVPVEMLAIGDLVLTATGVARPIKWIGQRSYAARFAYGRRHILPICVAAGAIGNRVPSRDLWLSPNHALYLDGVLIEARDLVNGASIVQRQTAAAAIEYFHIELDSHDVLIAEGALAETYSEDGNRLLFHNATEYRMLYPDDDAQPARYCAPRLAEGELVERVRTQIARRVRMRAAPAANSAGSWTSRERSTR
jgi:Hint domain